MVIKCSAQALNQLMQNQHWVKLTPRKEKCTHWASLDRTWSTLPSSPADTHKTVIVINKLKIVFIHYTKSRANVGTVSAWSETYLFPAHWGLRWVLHQRSSWFWHLVDKQRWVSRGFVDYIISEIITNRVWYHNVVKCGAEFGEWSHSASGPHWAHSRYKANDCTSYIYWWEVWYMLMLFFVQHVSFTQPYQHFTCACMDPSADFLKCSDHYCPLWSNPAIFVSTPAHSCRHINDTLHDDAHWMWHFYRTAAE